MFASDVIGRGMDFTNVDLVIQVGLPSSGEQYVHRGKSSLCLYDSLIADSTDAFQLAAQRELVKTAEP